MISSACALLVLQIWTEAEKRPQNMRTKQYVKARVMLKARFINETWNRRISDASAFCRDKEMMLVREATSRKAFYLGTLCFVTSLMRQRWCQPDASEMTINSVCSAGALNSPYALLYFSLIVIFHFSLAATWATPASRLSTSLFCCDVYFGAKAIALGRPFEG